MGQGETLSPPYSVRGDGKCSRKDEHFWVRAMSSMSRLLWKNISLEKMAEKQ